MGEKATSYWTKAFILLKNLTALSTCGFEGRKPDVQKWLFLFNESACSGANYL